MLLRQIFSKLLGMLALCVFALTLICALPTEAKAAMPSSSPNRTVVVLFRAYGNVPQLSGMEALSQKLEKRFREDSSKTFNSRVFLDYQQEDALNYVKSFDDIEHLVVAGYSFGGTTAVELANQLKPQKVDLLVEIDAVPRPPLDQPINVKLLKFLFPIFGFSDTSLLDKRFGNQKFVSYRQADQAFLELAVAQGFDKVNERAAIEAGAKVAKLIDISKKPDNVSKGINYFQITRNVPEERLQVLGITNIAGFENINVEELFGDTTITHKNIQSLSSLTKRIVDDIAAVCRDEEAKPVPEV